jgi:CRISPR system Cascade subunit CasE
VILTRLFLNPTNRDVQQCIADSHSLHVRVMALFPESMSASPRAAFGVLHRLEISEDEGLITLLVQSNDDPRLSVLPPSFLDPRVPQSESAKSTSLDALLASIETERPFHFRLRANPTRKIDTKSTPDGIRRNGRRVPLRSDHERGAWLSRKLAAGGMTIAGNVQQRYEGLTSGKDKRARVRTHDAYVFEGTLIIVAAEAARAIVRCGVGPGKAYGFGLLSLART